MFFVRKIHVLKAKVYYYSQAFVHPIYYRAVRLLRSKYVKFYSVRVMVFI